MQRVLPVESRIKTFGKLTFLKTDKTGAAIMTGNSFHPFDPSSKGAEPNRRSVIIGAGTALTLGAVAGTLGGAWPVRSRAAAPATGMPVMTVLYKTGDGVEFDFDYYRDNHLPMVMDAYGDAIARTEFRKSVMGEGPTPPYLAATSFWVADQEAFQAAAKKHRARLVKDVPNFTNAEGEVQQEEVYGMAGAPASSIEAGETCLSVLYPNGEDVRFDPDYYQENHIPLIMKLYGRDAVKRFELRRAVSQNGMQPWIATASIYVADRQAFAAAGKEHDETLVKDVPNFSSVNPTAFPTEIYAVL